MDEHIEASDYSDASASARTKKSTTQTIDREDHSLDSFAGRWAPEPPRPDQGLWFNGTNILIMIFGVVIPILIPAVFAVSSHKRVVLLLLAHPVETLVALALCLSIPITNLKLHRAICKDNFVFGLKPGLAAGQAIGTAVTIAIACMAAASVNTNNGAFPLTADALILANMWVLSALYLASSLVTLQLVLTIRKTKELDSAKKRILSYLCFGALSAAIILIGTEVQTLVAHYYERQALNSNPKISLPALSILRQANCEKQLRLLCADSRSAGLAGLFIPVKPTEAERLYFMIEGKPFMIENGSNTPAEMPIEPFGYYKSTNEMTAEQLRNFAIGAKIPGVSLTRSTINGNLHPDNLSATLVWTMVFQNEGKEAQTARAELSLPENAAITGAKVWQDGQAIDGNFSPQFVTSAYNNGGGSDGRLTELGRGKYLLQSKALTPDSQVKMQVTMVLPMELEQLESAQIKLPQIVDSNFSLEGDHNVEMLSDNTFENTQSAFTTGQREDGLNFLSGLLTTEQIEKSPVAFLCKRHPVTNLASCKDKGIFQQHFHKVGRPTEKKPGSPDGLYLTRQIVQTIAKAPGRVVVVLDGSVETANYLDQIKESLNHIPGGIPVSLMVASNEDKTFTNPENLKTALPKLKEVKFTGGQENLKALVKAAEFAGHTKEGVVLWLHGRQPAFHKEIYIISPFAFKPALYEFAYDPAEAVDDKFFRNHSELSAFSQVTRSGNQLADLSRFFRRWQAERKEYSVVSKMSLSALPNVVPVSEAVEKEVSALLARSLNSELVAQNARAESISFATRAGIVSLNSSISFYSAQAPIVVTSGPSLSDATNGTIVPQGAQAIVVRGVNTAGTIRVNNLANLEALLNLIANVAELIMVTGGIVGIIKGALLKGGSVDVFRIMHLGRTGLIVGGAVCIIVGLAVPGVLNFFVASARDAALFN